MNNRGERRIIETEINKGIGMARRTRKSPLLPRLLWGPQKRMPTQYGRVSVVRVPVQAISVAEDLLLAAGVFLGLLAFTLFGRA